MMAASRRQLRRLVVVEARRAVDFALTFIVFEFGFADGFVESRGPFCGTDDRYAEFACGPRVGGIRCGADLRQSQSNGCA